MLSEITLKLKKEDQKLSFLIKYPCFFNDEFQQDWPNLHIFAAFLNKKDTLKSLGLFMKGNEDAKSMEEEINTIHDILYKFTQE